MYSFQQPVIQPIGLQPLFIRVNSPRSLDTTSNAYLRHSMSQSQSSVYGRVVNGLSLEALGDELPNSIVRVPYSRNVLRNNRLASNTFETNEGRLVGFDYVTPPPIRGGSSVDYFHELDENDANMLADSGSEYMDDSPDVDDLFPRRRIILGNPRRRRQSRFAFNGSRAFASSLRGRLTASLIARGRRGGSATAVIQRRVNARGSRSVLQSEVISFAKHLFQHIIPPLIQ